MRRIESINQSDQNRSGYNQKLIQLINIKLYHFEDVLNLLI